MFYEETPEERLRDLKRYLFIENSFVFFNISLIVIINYMSAIGIADYYGLVNVFNENEKSLVIPISLLLINIPIYMGMLCGIEERNKTKTKLDSFKEKTNNGN